MKEVGRFQNLFGDTVMIMECQKCKTQFEVSVMIKSRGCPNCNKNKKGK